jgi:hypothetical protein
VALFVIARSASAHRFPKFAKGIAEIECELRKVGASETPTIM